ncbi:MFS transporter [Pseudomonas rubra]|uniref:MFS transporter n=1 Tax=Pseudomonas rubra TaxID=2942627 RepID=A0ABT5P781_9PSED|nr:MFS transporter [Pseudomonas rubra]MDD1013923.1 MFS transporter [Pseudomonas rubra]MDD1038857.1 MFS transporter [Pseudomonas rubra]MDD1154389.1 MFS transporter [Pseudomonas rubra]
MSVRSTSKRTIRTEMLIILLLMMSLLGVFPLDVILPSFPALGAQFAVETTQIAYSISLFALGVGVSQLVIGPLSDRIGRKRLLLLGLLASITGAVGCVLSSHYLMFIGFRMLQALGCGCFVLTQALVQDLFEGKQRNTLRILQTSASGLFISLSPLAGSWLQQALDWPGSFIVFALIACVVLLMSLFWLGNDVHRRDADLSFLSTYREICSNRPFMAYSAIAAIAFACHFSFIVVSPLLFMDRLGLSTYAFAQVFVLYGVAYVAGGVVAGRLNQRMNTSVQMLVGLSLIGLAGVIMLTWYLLGPLSQASILLPMIIATTGTTLTRPAATSCALALQPSRAGAAASMISTLVFAVGAATSSAVAMFSEHLMVGLGAGFVVLAAGAMQLLPRHPHRALDPTT